MSQFDDLHADDLQSVVEQLRANRPEATPLELDAVKQRVRARVAAGPARRRARSATLMKSRLAILTMLVVGLMLSTTGAGLAVDGLTSGNDASVGQYDKGDNGGDVLGEDDSNSPDQGDVAGDDQSDVQPTRQVENGAGSDQLPFTGFLAIPVLLGGVALLGTGLVLRRRAAEDDES
jgi:hypothetical protein